jgi:hypothetical protein
VELRAPTSNDLIAEKYYWTGGCDFPIRHRPNQRLKYRVITCAYKDPDVYDGFINLGDGSALQWQEIPVVSFPSSSISLSIISRPPLPRAGGADIRPALRRRHR